MHNLTSSNRFLLLFACILLIITPLRLQAAVRLSIFAAVVAFALQISYTGIAYMAVAALLLTFVDELSKAIKPRHETTHMISEPASLNAGTYQTGSWKNV